MPRLSSSSTATSSVWSETSQPSAARQQAADVLAQAQQLFDAKQYAEAAPLLQQLLRRDSVHTVALHLLGLIAHRIGMPNRTIRLLRQALRAGADSAELLNDLGAAYVEIGDLENARRCFARCVNRFPASPLGYVSLAFIHSRQGDFKAAESTYLSAIQLAAPSFEVKFNLATLQREWGYLDRAVEIYGELLRQQPHIGLLRDGRARARLQNKDWRQGWQDYEARLELEDEPAKINLIQPIPRWQGQSLSDKHLLILHEQGVGDEVQFASCYRDVIAQSGHATITCSPRLLPIFERSFPDATFIAVEPTKRESWTPVDARRFDYFSPAGSLPAFLRCKALDFPGRPYLQVAGNRREQRTHPTDKTRVGISWWGGAVTDQMRKRSVPLDQFKRLLDIPNIQFVNLQHGSKDESVMAELSGFLNLETSVTLDPYRELDTWFDLISSLDLLICVDNSNVHFAGAIGTPTWLLLPDHPNWRWPYGDEFSYWYSSVQFVRKRSFANWRSTIEHVVARLNQFVDQKDSQAA